jgi:hypothetical protein
MPSSQAEFPRTLAEVLFEELESTCPDLETELPVRERIEEIRALPTYSREQIDQIFRRERIHVDLSGGDLFGMIWQGKRELSAKLIPLLYEIIRKLPKRSALCLSGGGIPSSRRNLGVWQALMSSRGPKAPHSRSAIFNLGILQGLARCGLLDKFDYLSTVSGGGFIGSWLSAWICRQKGSVNNVVAQLAQPPHNSFNPEPDPIYNLRVYANYVSPKKGLLSVDTWTFLAVYLRNLLLNWLLFVPVIMALLMLPRIWVAFLRSPYLSPTVLLGIGFAGAAIALIYVGLNLPGAKQLNLREGWFVSLCLSPLVISAMALTTLWVRLGKGEQPGWWRFTLFALLLGTLPCILYVILKTGGRLRHREKSSEGEGGWLLTFVLGLVAAVVVIAPFALTGLVTWYLASTYVPPPLNLHAGFARTYATLAVPLLLVMLTLAGTLIAGLSSRFTAVDDQEWGARALAWILLTIAGWIVFHLLVLFGPSLVLHLERQLKAQLGNWTWTNGQGLLTALVTVISLVSGALTLFGGFRPKASPGEDADQQSESRAALLSMVMGVSTTISAAFILIFLVLATNWILASGFGEWAGGLLGAGASSLNANYPRTIIYGSPGRLLIVLSALFSLVGAILGRFINTNRFSLHFYWRNRIMRAYLGASRSRETKNKFTDYDSSDDLPMSALKEQKPLQVINVALNLAGGDKLEWQDRKTVSFTISPLHAGSYWLGYRNSSQYGGTNGITLATATAVSGAGVSPNMGNTLTSPVVRFIMILFNVRLGFWLGNPGVAGSGNSTSLKVPTFDRDSPIEAVRPIFAEALGLTNDQSPYVYLSDGGDFENLGLQEMVLRRCRFIVVSDTSTDPDYKFQSLAQAIRQVRVDFGVPIDMEEMRFGKDLDKAKEYCAIQEEPDKANKYCAIGVIRYSAIDKPLGSTARDEDYDGVLIYVKPSLDGSEPADVLNYHKIDDAFPQGTIVEGFTEAQFESYRMLGAHMIQTIYRAGIASGAPTLESFNAQVKAHLRQTP